MYIDQSILSKGCNAVIFDEFLDYGEATIDDLFRMLYVGVGIALGHAVFFFNWKILPPTFPC